MPRMLRCGRPGSPHYNRNVEISKKTDEEKQLEIVNKASKKAHLVWFLFNIAWWIADIGFGFLHIDLVPGITDIGEVILSLLIWGAGHIIITRYIANKRKIIKLYIKED